MKGDDEDRDDRRRQGGLADWSRVTGVAEGKERPFNFIEVSGTFTVFPLFLVHETTSEGTFTY